MLLDSGQRVTDGPLHFKGHGLQRVPSAFHFALHSRGNQRRDIARHPLHIGHLQSSQKKVSFLPVDNHFAGIQLPPVVCCQKPKLWCQKMKTKGPSLRLHALHKRPGKLAANLKQKQIHPHRSGPPAPNPFKHLTGSQRNLVSNLTSSLGGGSFVNGPINEKIPSFHAIRSRRIAFKRKTNSTAPAQSCRPKVGPGRSMT